MSLELPSDILSEIVRCLDPLGPDFPRFSKVCRSWHAASVENPRTWSNMPLLLLTEEDKAASLGGGIADTSRTFYDMSDGELITLTLPELCRRRCVGSTSGWFVTLRDPFEGDEILILNPFTRMEISLPPQSSLEATVPPPPPQEEINWDEIDEEDRAEPFVLPDIDEKIIKYYDFVQHITLSCSPSQKRGSVDCIALAVYYLGMRLAYARPSDTAWTVLPYDWGTLADYRGPFQTSAVYYDGHFYIVNCHGVVSRCSIPPADGISTGEEPPKAVAFVGPPDFRRIAQRYLVESAGEILQVLRFHQRGIVGDERLPVTVGFVVFKLVNAGAGEWERLKSLGNRALFLGLGTAMSVDAKDHVNCQKDCIYFTDDGPCRLSSFFDGGRGGGYDMGWYSMEEDAVYPLDKVDSRSPHSPPLWIMPSFQ